MKFKTHSAGATKAIAKRLAKRLKGGEVIGLVGPLGSGKTTFTQGLAEGLGLKKTVNSPTFIFMNVYNLPVKKTKGGPEFFVHFDAYRLPQTQTDEETLFGLQEYAHHSDAIVVIEWADRLADKIDYSPLITMSTLTPTHHSLEIKDLRS